MRPAPAGDDRNPLQRLHAGRVIGRKRSTCDLWGDRVDIAARMCSAAPVRGVAIDDMTQVTIGQQFPVAPPETLEIKGKGAMQVYRLLLPEKLRG